MPECPHGEPRGESACALCRHWWRGPSWRTPSDEVARPMPEWFRAMLDEWRAGGPLSVPSDRLADELRRRGGIDDDRPRYG